LKNLQPQKLENIIADYTEIIQHTSKNMNVISTATAQIKNKQTKV